jgi:hypothetical protein
LLILIHSQQGLGITSSVVAGIYLTTECLDSLILSQLLIHHACQLLSTSFFGHSGCSCRRSGFFKLLSNRDKGCGHLGGIQLESGSLLLSVGHRLLQIIQVSIATL